MDVTLLNSLGLILVAITGLVLAQGAQRVGVTVPARRMQQRHQDR